MSGHGPIFDANWPFTDRDCILDLARSAPLDAGMPKTPDRSPCPKALQQVARLDEQTATIGSQQLVP